MQKGCQRALNSSLSPRALVSRVRRKLLSRPPRNFKNWRARTAYFVLTIGHRLSQSGRMGSVGLPVFRVGPLVSADPRASKQCRTVLDPYNPTVRASRFEAAIVRRRAPDFVFSKRVHREKTVPT
jgi:hypothetical protein